MQPFGSPGLRLGAPEDAPADGQIQIGWRRNGHVAQESAYSGRIFRFTSFAPAQTAFA
jgi:hypothetical protein